VLNAEIGEYITTVRKDRYRDDWYLGSLTNEDPRSFEVSLSFLDEGAEYTAEIYADADGITWQNKADQVTISKKTVTAMDTLSLKLAPGGGAAVRFSKK
jgi:alpha-glucosidase